MKQIALSLVFALVAMFTSVPVKAQRDDMTPHFSASVGVWTLGNSNVPEELSFSASLMLPMQHGAISTGKGFLFQLPRPSNRPATLNSKSLNYQSRMSSYVRLLRCAEIALGFERLEP